MNWLQENKFVAVWSGVVLAGAIALGVFVFQAYGKFSEVSERFDSSAQELRRLQALKPFPNQENLTALQERVKEYAGEIANLRRELDAKEFQPEELTPTQFQDNLRTSVSELREKAEKAGVKLPADFYLGFEQYQNALPDEKAVPSLSRCFQAIRSLIAESSDARITELKRFARRPVPEEGGAAAARGARGGQQQGRPGREGEERAQDPLVQRQVLDMEFVADAGAFRQLLNRIAKSQQFFIVRYIRVANEKDKGPARGMPGGAMPGFAPPPAEGAPPPSLSEQAKRLEFIVGSEKLTVAMRLEILDFAGPDVARGPRPEKPAQRPK